MDKKSIFLGILFMAAGFLAMTWNAAQEKKAREEFLLRQAEAAEEAVATSSMDESASAPVKELRSTDPVDPPESAGVLDSVVEQVPTDNQPEEAIIVLSNDQLEIRLSTYGAAISRILLKEYPEQNPHTHEVTTPVTLNRVSDRPALALSRADGNNLIPLARFYEVVEQTQYSVTLRASLPSGLVIDRFYRLAAESDPDGAAPYLVEHQTVLRNTSDSALAIERAFLNVGTAAPTEADYMGFNLNASYFKNGDYDNIPASKFSGGGFLFKRQPRERIEERGILQWGAVKNQFFVTILTPEDPADAIVARGIRFPADPATGKIPMGITAAMEFGVPVLQPGTAHMLSSSFYAGPKDIDHLQQLGLKQEDVMQLGWFLGFFLGIIAFVAKALLTLMGALHGFLGNWGIAIILTTFIIRLLLWPLTAKAARASKRMQKLQKPLQEIREKYQDNPQKLNQEMMNLWKKHKINPLSGCWPVLVQFPIFIAFFNLLRNSSDLRFAEFLWINDLSMPDATIPIPGDASLPLVGTAINVLPFVWLVSMYFQMKMMPQPSMDNAQTKIIKWMPFIFFPFTYYFSSGLVLYWTTTNCFSIFQQWITNRTRDEEDVAIEEEIAEMEEGKNRKGLPAGPLISRKKKKARKKGQGPGNR